MNASNRITITETKAGRIARVKLQPGESILIVKDESFYQLGGQMDDVVPGHVLNSTGRVVWCHIQQAWRDA